jgi:hypothetical protein
MPKEPRLVEMLSRGFLIEKDKSMKQSLLAAAAVTLLTGAISTMAHANAILEITMKVDAADRAAAGAVYTKYKTPFMETAPGALAKRLLIREDDVQVLHEFKTAEDAAAYLKSDLFNKDVVKELKPLLKSDPDVRIYEAN